VTWLSLLQPEFEYQLILPAAMDRKPVRSSMGYTVVSFHVDWALVEGEKGHYRADGIVALEPFFDAA
jgi:hypothetical protein